LIGTSDANSYGNAWYNNTNWTDYTVQGTSCNSPDQRIGRRDWRTIESGDWRPLCGVGLSGKFGGGGPSLKLIKFEGWQSWSGVPMQSVSLPGVGTNAHLVAMTFSGANISISFDGAQMINVTDNNYDGVAPYTNGGITADMYTDTSSYTFTVDNVIVEQIVTPPVTANSDSYSVTAGSDFECGRAGRIGE